MVLYFSGTGNSHWVAKSVATAFSDRLIAMGDYFREGADKPKFELEKGERIGFVFPVHSWGMPPLVKKFIKMMELTDNNENLVYGIFSCGDECGNTHKMFIDALAERGMECRHVYSIQMPNNYISMPGFDIDSKELEAVKKENAKQLLPHIIKAIETDQPMDCYTKGTFTFLKSGLIYNMFCKYAIDSKPFYSTDSCDSCGVCVKKCPTGNIKLVDGRPVWGNNCTQCLGCIHYCHVRAIEYGKVTVKKGRYTY